MRESAVRGALGISLDVLAAHLGCSRPTLTKYELDPRNGVTNAALRGAISRFYGMLREIVERTKNTAKEARHASARDVREPGSERRPRRSSTARGLRSATA